MLRWCDQHNPDGYVDWYPFEHPQLGAVELGGWNELSTWTNPPRTCSATRSPPTPTSRSTRRCARHGSRSSTPPSCGCRDDTWRIEAGIANTGFFATDVTAAARSPSARQARLGRGGRRGRRSRRRTGPATAGHLDGRAALRFTRAQRRHARPGAGDLGGDRPEGSVATVTAISDKIGRISTTVQIA